MNRQTRGQTSAGNASHFRSRRITMSQPYAQFETTTITRKRTWFWAAVTVVVAIGAAVATTYFIVQGIGPLM